MGDIGTALVYGAIGKLFFFVIIVAFIVMKVGDWLGE